jgi:hypothetical protein
MPAPRQHHPIVTHSDGAAEMILEDEPGLEPADQPTPRAGRTEPPSPRLRELAASLDCLLSEDVCELGRVTPNTETSWAKRGDGPPYIMFGNRRLYPRDTLREFLQRRLKTRGVPVRGLL